MATLNFNVFKSTEGKFSLTNESTVNVPSIRDYLFSKYTDEQKTAYLAKNTKSTRTARYRAGQSEGFKKYCEENKTEITFELAGSVQVEFDGRLREGSVKIAILNALNAGESKMKVYPESNSTKPAHEHLVYIKEFTFIEIEK